MDESQLFKIGTRKLHSEPNFNYQLNRVVLWNGGDWDEVAAAATRISCAADWERELLALGEKALKESRLQNAVGYFRMAEFFMFDGNPRKIEVYRRAKKLFAELYAPVFQSGEIHQEHVPFGGDIVNSRGHEKSKYFVNKLLSRIIFC